MKAKQLETLKVTKDAHKKVVAYCKKTGQKVYFWASNILLQAVEKEGK